MIYEDVVSAILPVSRLVTHEHQGLTAQHVSFFFAQISFFYTITAQDIVVQDLSPSLARHFAVPPLSGVLVAQVSGLAARAGLMCGDIITAVNKHRVHSISDFLIAMAGFRDPYVSFSVTRGQRTRTITVEREGAGAAVIKNA